MFIIQYFYNGNAYKTYEYIRKLARLIEAFDDKKMQRQTCTDSRRSLTRLRAEYRIWERRATTRACWSCSSDDTGRSRRTGCISNEFRTNRSNDTRRKWCCDDARLSSTFVWL